MIFCQSRNSHDPAPERRTSSNFFTNTKAFCHIVSIFGFVPEKVMDHQGKLKSFSSVFLVSKFGILDVGGAKCKGLATCAQVWKVGTIVAFEISPLPVIRLFCLDIKWCIHHEQTFLSDVICREDGVLHLGKSELTDACETAKCVHKHEKMRRTCT